MHTLSEPSVRVAVYLYIALMSAPGLIYLFYAFPGLARCIRLAQDELAVRWWTWRLRRSRDHRRLR